MKIGIFGGSFSPPHKMHQNIATSLIKKNYLDKVIFTPTSNYYNKKDLIPAKKRLHMLLLITKNNPNLEVSDYEFSKLTYTYQTLTYFKEKYHKDEIYFICGSDNLKEFTTWKEYKWILTNFKIIVIKRNNDNIEEIIKAYSKYQENIKIFPIEEEPISSTMIRSKIKEKNLTKLKELLNKDIYEYIIKEHLYL